MYEEDLPKNKTGSLIVAPVSMIPYEPGLLDAVGIVLLVSSITLIAQYFLTHFRSITDSF